MQEHSSKIFGDIVDALGGFVQSCFSGAMYHHHTPSAAATNSSNNGGHVTGSGTGSARHMHQFSLRNVNIQAEALPPNAHTKPIW